jgi:hypothetical protein
MQLYTHEKCEEEEVTVIMQNILLQKVEVKDHLIKHQNIYIFPIQTLQVNTYKIKAAKCYC